MLDEWRNRLIIPFGLGTILFILVLILYVAGEVGTEHAPGSLLYLLGWILVGRGHNITENFKLNMIFAVVVLMLSFFIWWIIMQFLGWLRDIHIKEKDLIFSTLVWVLSFALAAVFMAALGYFLMWYGLEINGVSQIPLHILGWQISDDILYDWEESVFDTIVDAVSIPIFIGLFIVAMKLCKGYHVQGM